MRATLLLIVTACNSALGIGTPHESISDVGVTVSLAAPDPLAAGGSFAFTVEVANAGPDPAIDVLVLNQLPRSATFVGVADSDWECQADGSQCVLRGLLPVGPAPAISYAMFAQPEAGMIVDDVAVFTLSTDPVLANNDASITAAVAGRAELSIAVSGPGSAGARGDLAYSIVVTNEGPSVAVNPTVTLTPSSADLLITNLGGSGWSCAGLTCTRAPMAAGTSATLDVEATAPVAGGTVGLTAAIESSILDLVPADDVATAFTDISALADLQLSIGDSPDPVPTNGSLTYTLTVDNLGPSDATSVTVTDTLPAGATLSGAGGAGWSCSSAGQVVTCSCASLGVGTAPALTIVLTVPSSPSTLSNTATVTSVTSDPAIANNATSATTTSVVSADLALLLFDSSPTPAPIGGVFRYRLGIANLIGSSTATAIVATLELPAGVTLSGTAGTGWSCNGAGSTVTCTRASAAPGSLPTLFIDVTSSTAGQAVATASVSAATFDPDLQNNAASLTTTIGTCTVWNLASDFRVSPNQENPNRDSHGNSGVWHFMESTSLAHVPATYSVQTNFTTNYQGHAAGVEGWFNPTAPSESLTAYLNASGADQLVLGQVVFPNGTFQVHPASDRLSVLGWRSPIAGTVAVSGQAIDRNSTCGNGFSWFIARDGVDLASGVLDNGDGQTFASGVNGASLANLSIGVGQFLYFLVDPRDGDFFCDSTELDVTITRCQ